MLKKKDYFFWPIIFCMFLYFAYHMLNGQRGVIAIERIKLELIEKKIILEDLKKKKNDLAIKATLMRPDSLDLDYLEERARTVLGLGYPDEIIIDSKNIIKP